jgi:hypothetical protein
MAEINGKINSNERFVRWQTALRDHLTFLNSLLLTISTGIVGFLVSILKGSDFNPVHFGKCFFTLGLLLAFLSTLIGILTGFSRLIDFQCTLNKIKKELSGDNISEIADLKAKIGIYSKITWRLFYFQSGLLLFGIMFLFGAITIIFKEKLF